MAARQFRSLLFPGACVPFRRQRQLWKRFFRHASAQEDHAAFRWKRAELVRRATGRVSVVVCGPGFQMERMREGQIGVRHVVLEPYPGKLPGKGLFDKIAELADGVFRA